MQKEIIRNRNESDPPDIGWIDATNFRVRLSSEDASSSIESALGLAEGIGWRAADSGEQRIIVGFESPARVRHIRLRFEASETRTQEFVLRWSQDHGSTFREIVRQQYNFSPAAHVEQEDYTTDLVGATDVELLIVPDISDGPARASLRELRFGDTLLR
jgi:hypothetical protein